MFHVDERTKTTTYRGEMPQKLFRKEQRIQLVLRKRTQLRYETPSLTLIDYYLNDDGLILLISRIIFNSFFSEFINLLTRLSILEYVLAPTSLETFQSLD